MKRTLLKRRTPLKAKKGLKPISYKKTAQMRKEAKLKRELFIKQGGRCADCGTSTPDWRGWQKHELIFRSHGGDPLDSNNCIVVCAKCQSARHGIIER